MRIGKWMDQSLRNWLLVGAPILITVGALLAVVVRFALRITWAKVIAAEFWFVMVQIVAFGSMYSIRKHAGSRNTSRLGLLVSALYCLAMGLLIIHYSARWGLILPADLQSNYEWFSVMMAAAALILLFVPLPWIRSKGNRRSN